MDTDLWCMYKITDESEEASALRAKHQNAVSHDGTNNLFVSLPENTGGMYTLPDSDLTSMVLSAAAHLYSGSGGMVLTRAQAESLFRHPAHRLWCASYEEDQMDLFESDYNANRNYALSVGLDNWPDFSVDLTPADARNIMLETLASSSMT
ncbi:hypothetical protein Q4498_01645 [Neptunomonas phycophila]|uniref:hypothetical protein n=1 Tax=Neptunomonas phycophila TaxID=1572645 RepID=UPI0026E2EC03|nr:hypothetical protein [Neptunomonas phycophila]MDO6466801.1 hypothetical protein [Neptunomonas phycophila]